MARYAFIKAPVTGAIPWIIADGVRRDYGVPWLMDFSGDWKAQTQIVAPLAANFSRPKSLGNLSGTKPFSVEINFRLAEDAFLFAERLPLDIVLAGTLETGINGVASASLIYPGAVIESFKCRSTGDTSLAIDYVILVGEPDEKPTAGS